MVVIPTGAAEPLLWITEIEHRRGRRLFTLALCIATAGVVVSILIDADARDVSDTALTFWLTACTLSVALGSLMVVLTQSQQIEYARACLRYFAGLPPETLTTLREDPRWRPGGGVTDLAGVFSIAIALASRYRRCVPDRL